MKGTHPDIGAVAEAAVDHICGSMEASGVITVTETVRGIIEDHIYCRILDERERCLSAVARHLVGLHTLNEMIAADIRGGEA